MAFISCGVKIDGKRPTSKTELRKVLADDILADSVTFYCTDVYGSFAGRSFFACDIADDASLKGVTINIVGPDPYTSRKFYGTIVVKSDGTLTVK